MCPYLARIHNVLFIGASTAHLLLKGNEIYPVYSVPTFVYVRNQLRLVMLLLISATLLLKRYGTQAVPLYAPSSTSSTFDAPIFAREEPSAGCHSRTVLDIVWSCLATTFACTWVSVHPNVPWRNEGKWILLARRIFLMIFSILTPEFMIMWALKQCIGAVMIRDAVNEASMKAFPNPRESVRS